MNIREDLIRDEGWVPHAYQDHLGFWTIGFGFLIDQRRGGGVPMEVAEFWLDLLVAREWNELCRDYPWFVDAPPAVQRAVQNMRYQLGRGGLARFRHTLAALERRDYLAAADHALDSNWARQTPKRANRVADLIRSAADAAS